MDNQRYAITMPLSDCHSWILNFHFMKTEGLHVHQFSWCFMNFPIFSHILITFPGVSWIFPKDMSYNTRWICIKVCYRVWVQIAQEIQCMARLQDEPLVAWILCPGVVLDAHGLRIKIISHRCLKGDGKQVNYLTIATILQHESLLATSGKPFFLHLSWIKNLSLPLGYNCNLTPLKFKHSPWKMVVGRRAFPMGKVPFQGQLGTSTSGRIHLVIGGTNSNTPRFGRHLAGTFCWN